MHAAGFQSDTNGRSPLGVAHWPRPKADRRYQEALHELARWSHAVTVTFVRFDRYGRPCDQHVMTSAVRHFLRVLNIRCHGRRRFNKGLRIPAVVTFGMGSSGAHPHGHMTLACPADTDFTAFQKLIHAALRKTRWFDQEFVVKPYTDGTWISYMLGHDAELYMDLPRPAHPSIG